MRLINSLDELTMPAKHRIYLQHLLEYFKSYPVIEKVLLFGSCAKGDASPASDIDVYLLGSNISDEDEWNIAWNCPKWEGVDYISCDILSGTYESYKKHAIIPGMVQCAIEMMGVDISGLLQTG